MSEKDYAEANAFVAWIVGIINKIKELFAALMAFLGGEPATE